MDNNRVIYLTSLNYKSNEGETPLKMTRVDTSIAVCFRGYSVTYCFEDGSTVVVDVPDATTEAPVPFSGDL